MVRLHIKNLGPIVDTGNIAMTKVTIFIGDQATGKSTITKIFSTMRWLEKKINQDDISQDNIELPEYLEVHNIHTYIKDNTEIMYSGILYDITYKNNITTVTKRQPFFIEDDAPKIMYIPSERNLLSYLEKPEFLEQIRNLPLEMRMFIAEYNNCITHHENPTQLPIQDIEFVYDKNHKQIYIQNTSQSYKIPLNHASSGIQSIIPLFIVTKYLTEFTSQKYIPSSNLSIDDLRKQKIKNEQDIKKIKDEIEKLIKKILINISSQKRINATSSSNLPLNHKKKVTNSNMGGYLFDEFEPVPQEVQSDFIEVAPQETQSDFINEDWLKEYEDKSNKLKELGEENKNIISINNIYNSFTNIIEEPELNLHPKSQDKITYWLLKCNNTLENNQLVITTHSPYIIQYICLAIKAYNIQKKIDDSNIKKTKQKLCKEKLYQIIDKNSCIEPNAVSVYEVKNGGVEKLKTYGNGIPSDDNELNNELAIGNDIFDNLLEIENEVDNEVDNNE